MVFIDSLITMNIGVAEQLAFTLLQVKVGHIIRIVNYSIGNTT